MRNELSIPKSSSGPEKASRRIVIACQIDWPLRWFWDMIAGAQEYAATEGWASEVCNVPEMWIEDGVQVDGIVGRITPATAAAADAAGIPVVNVWANSPVSDRVASVLVDYEVAGRIAAEHLYARGFRRIIALGPKKWCSTPRFNAGVEAVAKDKGIVFNRFLLPTSPEENNRKWRQIKTLLKRLTADWEGPVGLAVHLDVNARMLATILGGMGWKIPEEVAIVGTGNEPLTCTAIAPTITSVDMGHRRNGYQATAVLHELMRGNTVSPGPIYMPPKELVTRATTDIYAVRDPQVQRALRYMAENCHVLIGVNHVVSATEITRPTLERRFQRHLQTTIHKELTRLRIERLKRLLVENEMPICELASNSGFGTIGSMYLAFKTHTGMPPEAFRKAHADLPR